MKKVKLYRARVSYYGYVFDLSDQKFRDLIDHLTDRIEYNLDPKAQPKLKKNLEYLQKRYYDDGSRIK